MILQRMNSTCSNACIRFPSPACYSHQMVLGGAASLVAANQKRQKSACDRHRDWFPSPYLFFFFFFLLSLFCFYVFMGLFPFFNCGFTVESEPPLAAAVRQGRRRRLLVCLGPSRNYTFSSSWRVMRMQRGPVGWPGGCALGRPDAPGGCRCDKGK